MLQRYKRETIAFLSSIIERRCNGVTQVKIDLFYLVIRSTLVAKLYEGNVMVFHSLFTLLECICVMQRQSSQLFFLLLLVISV